MNDSVSSISATRNQRRLLIALALAATYMVAQFIGGLLTGSLALLADAGHMLSDVFALAMSAAAIQIARLPPTPSKPMVTSEPRSWPPSGTGFCSSASPFISSSKRLTAPAHPLKSEAR